MRTFLLALLLALFTSCNNIQQPDLISVDEHAKPPDVFILNIKLVGKGDDANVVSYSTRKNKHLEWREAESRLKRLKSSDLVILSIRQYTMNRAMRERVYEVEEFCRKRKVFFRKFDYMENGFDLISPDVGVLAWIGPHMEFRDPEVCG